MILAANPRVARDNYFYDSFIKKKFNLKLYFYLLQEQSKTPKKRKLKKNNKT